MRELVLYFLVGVLFAVGHSHSIGSKNVNELTIVKTAKTVNRMKDNCYIYEVYNLKPIYCNVDNVEGEVVPHGANCSFRQQPGADGLDQTIGTVKELICINGHWSGTDYSVGPLNRQRRFWPVLAAVGVGLVVGGVIGYFVCKHFCPKPDAEKVVEVYTYHPPTFKNLICTPNEIQDNYYVAADQSVVIRWTDPVATDENGDTPTVQQSGGIENGGRFRGSIGGKTHLITYTAEDEDDLKGHCSFTITVTEATCTAPPWPDDGQRYCSDGLRVGKTCQYQCHSGYELVGDTILTCENVTLPQWSSDVPICTKIKCVPSPTPPANGTVTCTDDTFYQSLCFFDCNKGFTLQGQTFTLCQEDGTWIENVGFNTTCIDESPPSLNCKSPQIFYADRGASYTSVMWVMPTATDPTDPAPNVYKTSGPSLGDVISVGIEFVTYIAIDSDGNESPVCSIELRVQEITCGHPLDTFQDKYIQFTCSGPSYTYGVACNVWCSANLPLEGADLITCEDNGEAVGIWKVSGNDTNPYCREIACPPLDPPINGALVYDSILTRPIYTMLCNNEYDLAEFSFGIFFCLDQGEWSPGEVPDCIKAINPGSLQLPGEIYYYEGDCGTNETNADIEDKFQTILIDVIHPLTNAICPDVDNCTAENIVIICGDIDPDVHARRKRSTSSDVDMHRKKRSIKNIPETRQKRQAESATLVIKLAIVVTITLPEGDMLMEHIDYYDDIVAALSAAMQELLNNGSLDIPNFTTRNDSWVAQEYADIVCDTGYVFDGNVCKPCPSGYYRNETTSICELCPVGQYGSGDGIIECMACPTGYSTRQNGSKSLDNCTELCEPGSISPDGMVPCSTCLYGEYQGDVGQTTCIQCPRGTSTLTTNSTSSENCRNYDVLIEETDGPISLTDINSSMTLMFWTKRVDAQTMSTIIQIKNDGDDLCILYPTDNFRIQLPNQMIDETIVELSSDTWTHQSVVWNTDDNEVDVYIDGALEFTSAISNSSPLITHGELTLTASGQTGLYMTGFYVYDRVLTSLEITTHASSCHVTSNDDVINVDIFRNHVADGISVIAPSKCDAVNNCQPDPCNGHQCIDEQDNFTCYCNSGWSGRTCFIPPDYCTDNQCSNGATCQSGHSNYTCDCLQGYSGLLCEIAPVNGEWSEWVITSACTQLCGTGSQTRTRSCDSPVPDLYGADCVGDDEDTIPCNTEACQVCEDLPTPSGTVTSCMTNMTTGIRTCELYCEDDKIMPPGLPDYKEYECGSHTSYEWEHAETLPSCVEPSAPTQLEITTSIEYTTTISDGDIANLTDSILDNFQSTPCADICQVSVQLSNTGTTLTVSYSMDLSLGPDLHIDEYIADGTVSGSLQEFVDAVSYLELSAQHIENNTADMFNVVVNGVPYTTDTSSLTIQGVVTCPSGQVANEGACLKCPTGTYYNGDYCTYCDMGTYQPSTGQSECIHCPSHLTTKSIGSTDLSKCSEYLMATTSITNLEPTPEPKSNTTVIVSVVLSVAALVIACLAFALVWYKKCRPKNNVHDSRSYISARSHAPVHYRKEVSNVSLSSMPNSRPTTPGDLFLAFQTNQCTGSDESRYTPCPPNGRYVTPKSRAIISPPPAYDEKDGLPEYTEKDENP